MRTDLGIPHLPFPLGNFHPLYDLVSAFDDFLITGKFLT